MSKVKISKVMHEVFGNCMKLENGIIELWVTIDVGPRVIHCSRLGKENMFYEDLDKTDLGDSFDVYGGETLKLYGGHRLWISPEILPRCYYPDSKPVECKEIENGMEFIAPVETINGIQKSIAVKLVPGEASAKIEHGVKNCGQWDIELAPWAITMFAEGSVEVMPMPNTQTGMLPNRNIALWDYAAMNDSRVYWGKNYITLRQDRNISQPFKMGFNNEAGWSAIFNKGQVFFKFFEPQADGLYPDGGCCYESYTNDKMLEAESLGEIELISPGQWIVHVEEWEIYEAATVPSNNEAENNETEIERIIAEYL